VTPVRGHDRTEVTSTDDDEEARRREWRQFVLEHHPDRGGDPEVFAAGVRAYREGRRPRAVPQRAEQYLTTHHTPRGLGHITRWARRRWDGWTRPPRVQ
jgi:curved DNA-binding protein CbpA